MLPPKSAHFSPGKNGSVGSCKGQCQWEEALQMLATYTNLSKASLDAFSLQVGGKTRQLQQALTESHSLLFKERQKVLQLQRVNDELRIALRDKEQEHPARLGEGDRTDSDEKLHLSVGAAQSFVDRIEVLQAQLREQVDLNEEQTRALTNGFEMDAESPEDLHLSQSLEQLQKALSQATKDYILAKRDKYETQLRLDRLTEEQAEGAECHARDLAAVRQKAAEDAEEARKVGRAREAKQRSTMRKLSARLADLDEVHESTRAAYEARLKKLEQQLAKCRKQGRALEVRRALDMEGWTVDVATLRKQLAATARKVDKIKLVARLPDDERLDELLALLQQKSPDVEGREGGILPGSESQRQASIAGPAAELASVHSGIKSLEKCLLAKSKT